MNGFIIAPRFNSPGFKDATGAFHLGAEAFSRLHSLPAPVLFNNEGKPEDVAGRFRGHLEAAAGGWDVFAYFGHGDNTCLPSAGFGGKYGAKVLADLIRAKANYGVTVLFYACNTGVKDGWASWVADELSDIAATVYAHVPPPGHSFTNANVVCYPGGDWVIDPQDPLWADWYHDMHDEANDLWARFPFMTEQELRAELSAPEFLLGRWKVGDKDGSRDTVFFGDQSVVQTSGDRFSVVARGSWSATKHRLTVTWDGGATETWALPLSLKGQNVRLVEDGKPRMLKATRTEPIEINPILLFASAAVRAQLIDI